MLQTLEIPIKLSEGMRIHHSMGSLFQGALMEILPSDIVERFHTNGLRPYSQYVYFDKSRCVPVWRIGTLTKSAGKLIESSISCLKQLLLRQKGYVVSLQQCEIHKISYEQIREDMMLSNNVPKGAEIKFLTPVAFRRNGTYVMFPEFYLIFQSLIKRWNLYSSSIPIDDDNLDLILPSFCEVKQYTLRSQVFSVEHQNITGFCGNINLRFHGNDLANRLIGLLLKFSNFSGVGIKTALGMGAMRSRVF